MYLRYIYLVLAGLIGGLIGGMGMGGGTLLIPILTLFIDVPQHIAQWINLIAFVPMGAIALIIHIKNKLVSYKKILPLLLPALITAVLSSLLVTKAPPILLRQFFGSFLILMGIFSLIMTWYEHKHNKEENNAENDINDK